MTGLDEALIAKIKDNNKIMPSEVEKVLLIHDFPNFYIGDTCVRFAKLRAISEFFPKARVDINCSDKEIPLLINNPFVQSVTSLQWDEIEFNHYDVLIYISLLEMAKDEEFLSFIKARYILELPSLNFALFSLSRYLNPYQGKPRETPIPMYLELGRFFTQHHKTTPFISELFISEEERKWGETWLRRNGLEEDENLIILLDSSNNKGKLLKLDVYFEVLTYLIGHNGTKVLIFDEKGMGKQEFYEEWLGFDTDQLIFAVKLSLRQALCILSSSKLNMILGPCTGLLHCASGIYYNSLKNNIVPNLPTLVTYIGNYDDDYNPWIWWQNSMVKCIMVVKNIQGNKEIQQLKDENFHNFLSCDEYSSDLLIDYLKPMLNIH
ncbi:MAG: hypothetical protein V4708_08305 [Bacteroidota bacterium]